MHSQNALIDDVASESTPAVKQVICINWGTKYGAPYINRLYAMVARNISPPFTVTCFTDNAAGLVPEIQTRPLPDLPAPYMPTNTKGIWQKSRLWGEYLGGLEGVVLFLDLDVVIVGSLDPFFQLGDPRQVFLARNQTTPFEKLGQTSVYRFTVGDLVSLQEKFCADPQGIADEYRFEQRYVTRNAPGGANFFPRKWVLHFRQDCRRPFPLNYFLAPRLPKTARIVLFPGGYLPPHAIEGRAGKKGRAVSRLQHIRDTFGNRPAGMSVFRHLRYFVKPSAWVAQHWRE